MILKTDPWLASCSDLFTACSLDRWRTNRRTTFRHCLIWWQVHSSVKLWHVCSDAQLVACCHSDMCQDDQHPAWSGQLWEPEVHSGWPTGMCHHHSKFQDRGLGLFVSSPFEMFTDCLSPHIWICSQIASVYFEINTCCLFKARALQLWSVDRSRSLQTLSRFWLRTPQLVHTHKLS